MKDQTHPVLDSYSTYNFIPTLADFKGTYYFKKMVSPQTQILVYDNISIWQVKLLKRDSGVILFGKF